MNVRWSAVLALTGTLACGSDTHSPAPVTPDPAKAPPPESPTPEAPSSAEIEPAPTPESTGPSPSAVEPAPSFDPVPPITTDIDPSVFHWSHNSDEHAFIEVIVRLGDSPASETWRVLARDHEDRMKPARDIGMPDRFARGDRWVVFGPNESVFHGKAKGFWPESYGRDMVSLRVVLGRGPEGLAVRARDWKGRPENLARWGRALESDDPALGEVVEVLNRSIGRVAKPSVVELLHDRPLTVKDVRATPGRFCGGDYLVESVAGVMVLGLDGRVTPVIGGERATGNGDYVWGTLDLDDDGYDEAVVERSETSGDYANLLYWREGLPMLEPLVLEDA